MLHAIPCGLAQNSGIWEKPDSYPIFVIRIRDWFS